MFPPLAAAGLLLRRRAKRKGPLLPPNIAWVKDPRKLRDVADRYQMESDRLHQAGQTKRAERQAFFANAALEKADRQENQALGFY